MINNNGRMSVVLPSNLQGGYYLVRPEFLALHNAVKGDPQFYIGCAQIFLESSGNLTPESTVSIPGYVKAGEESVSFNIYYNPDNKPYPVPGPAVAKLKAGAATTQKSQDEGVKPAGCILENANWCGYEVPSYTNEAGCWAVSFLVMPLDYFLHPPYLCIPLPFSRLYIQSLILTHQPVCPKLLGPGLYMLEPLPSHRRRQL
jgi:Auxiliary Activity family 9 (formerly GH61)